MIAKEHNKKKKQGCDRWLWLYLQRKLWNKLTPKYPRKAQQSFTASECYTPGRAADGVWAEIKCRLWNPVAITNDRSAYNGDLISTRKNNNKNTRGLQWRDLCNQNCIFHLEQIKSKRDQRAPVNGKMTVPTWCWFPELISAKLPCW